MTVEEIDYLILGGGPAGLQLGYYLKSAHRKYLILESGETPGTFFKHMPRHRQLLSINKLNTGYDDPELNLRWDWNSLLTDDDGSRFTEYAKEYFPHADALVDYLGAFARQHDLNILCNAEAIRVSREGEGFRVELRTGQIYACRWLVVATGLRKPFIPEIRGIEFAERYDSVSVEPQKFRNLRVLIIGKGNSAFETANNLVDSAAVIHVASRHPVALAWNTHHVGDLRAVNDSFLDTYLLKTQNAALEVTLDYIEKSSNGYDVKMNYLRAEGSGTTIQYDRVIACTGFRFDSAIFDPDCRPVLERDDRFPSQSCCWESKNVSDMYFAGNLMQVRDYKKTSSAFIHGFRYNVRALHRILESRNHGRSWPCSELGSLYDDAISRIIERLNRSSALWLQFGFFADVIVEPRDDTPGRYYEDVPVDYVHTLEITGDHPYLVVTLEYGRSDFDALRDDRVSHTDVEDAADSTALHPVIRRYGQAELLSELHLIENLEAIWRDEDLHVRPLRRYIETCSAQAAE